MAKKLYFGEPEFFNNIMIRDYVNNGRLLLRPLYNELAIAGEELQAVLTSVGSANPSMFGMDSLVRGRLVAAHLRRSSAAVRVASKELVRTYQSFKKHYAPEIDEQRRKKPRRFEIVPE